MSTKPASTFTAGTKRIAEGLPDILQGHPVSIAYLYGSAVSGKTTPSAGSVESCIDVANHIIAEEGYRPPESYADSFAVLAENGIVEQDFLPTLRQMARMRNRLVHLYWEIDTAVLHSTLQNNLNDFDRFTASVYRFMQGSTTTEQEPDL